MSFLKFILVLAVFVTLSQCILINDDEFDRNVAKGLRLIQTNETTTLWVTPEEIDRRAATAGAGLGFFDITDHRDLSPAGLKVKVPFAPYPPPKHQAYINPLFARISIAEMTRINDGLTNFFNRYYTAQYGVDAANWIRDRFREYAGVRSDVTVALYNHAQWAQPSVIATVRGTVRQDVTVIIGGHEDSTAGGATARSPGADDDGTGTMTVLESFRILMSHGWRPEINVEFQTYAAEEGGLRGSQAIAQAYQAAGRNIYGMLQFDMTSYRAPGASAKIGVITDFTNADVNVFLRQLIQTYTPLPFGNTQCGYACSDHASWTRAGYPAGFVFEGLFSESNPNIHTNRDLIGVLNLQHGAEFVKVAIGFVVELAGIGA